MGQNRDLEGIKIGNEEKRLSQYADDLWTSTIASQKNLDTLVNLFNQYAHFSGLSINYNKTTLLRVGSMWKTDAKLYSRLPLIWSDGPIKILEIYVSPDSCEMLKLNYEESFNKARSVLNTW